MKAKITLLFAALTLFVSCTSSNTFSQFDKMPENNRWEKSDSKVYEFEINDSTYSYYNIVFRFSHVYDYQFDSVPLTFVIESPDGKKEILAIDIPIKETNGKEIAECAGDICDLKYQIKTKTKLSKGTYRITVSHNFKGASYLPNVIGIGLEVNP